IGVPVSNVAGIGNGAKNGILLKGSEVISDFSKLDVMVFDKTGTLTTGTPAVNHVKTYTKDSSLALAYLKSVEKESDHPLAKAIVDYIKEDNVYVVNKTNIVKGGGILAQIDERKVAIGNLKLMKDINIPLSEDVMQNIKQLESTGHSIVITAIDQNIELLIGIKDQIRPNLKQDLQKIKRLGVKELIILSGDNQGTVDLVALELGLTKAYGNMLPEDKQAYIKKLQSEGKRVAFVGDGVNDSPSLALANIGIAMGSGTDVAIETSNVVLMNSNFSKIPHALGLAKKIVINMKQNIIIAVGVVLVLLASVLFSQWMNMSIGMLVHELSILVVIVNGMRLLKYKIKKEEKLK
ncbi:MAG: HAD-IC family P-type ATPase, partial [Firmicutes bacterium]|nr:HAD-IC family P-type ATPase [Bacillota bacterium]